MSLAYDAMQFAMQKHHTQRRKYTGAPYVEHLAQVVGIALSVGWHRAQMHPDKVMATAWLHDVSEDQGVGHVELLRRFGPDVADGVRWLTDVETGNRGARKAAAVVRLAAAPPWVQDIKVADIISNTESIAEHDRSFAMVYLPEVYALLLALEHADQGLRGMAEEQVRTAMLEVLA